jgi:hypothetical protein
MSRDRSPVVSVGIFAVATDVTMCPGVDSYSKNECQDTPGGKDGWRVRVTTYHLHSANSREDLGALIYRIPQRHAQACSGTALPLPLHYKDEDN